MRVRATLVLLAVAASPALIASPAAAEENSTLVLDPGYVEVGFTPVESWGARPVDASVTAITEVRAVPVRPGGTVTVALPPGAELGEGRPGEYRNAGEYTFSTAPATALGGSRYRFALPNGAEGTEMWLDVNAYLPTTIDVPASDLESGFKLRFSSSAPADVALTEQVFFGGDACERKATADCASSASVPAGGDLTVTLPATSRFVALGISDLSQVDVALLPEIWGTDTPEVPTALAAGRDGRTVTVSVPRDTAPGRYWFTVAIGGPTSQTVAAESGVLTVLPPVVAPAEASTAAPTTAPVTEPAPSAELPREAVTATAPATASSATPLYLLGAGVLVVAAGVVGALLVRRRKTTVTEEAPPPPAEDLVSAGTP